MDKKKTQENEFRKRLLATFKIESQDHLQTISVGVVELEKAPSAEVQADLVETVFRGTHSLKGAARAVNLTDIEALCQALEGVFSNWKKSGVKHSQEGFDAIYVALDHIRSLLSSIDSGEPFQEKAGVSRAIQDLARIEKEENRPGAPAEPWAHAKEADAPSHAALARERFIRETPSLSGTVRISASKLGSLLLQAEEMLNSKLAANQHLQNLKELSSMMSALKSECTKAYIETSAWRAARKNGVAGAADAGRLNEFFTWTQTHLKSMESRMASVIKSAAQQNRTSERMIDTLLENMKNAAMLPFSTILESFPMLVRDISREEGKVVDLVVSGEGIEVDRRVLDEMKDPLMHLVRNCVDHGIERTDERLRAGKRQRGTITISIAPVDSGKAELTVSDDGAGVDASKVKKAAVEGGVISQAESDALTDKEALPLIFQSGVSTTPIITDISGRGLGLAIVREKVENLGGSVRLETTPGKGTAFRIMLPLKIATFRGILVRSGEHVFIIPTVSVERTLRVRNEEIKTVENRETIVISSSPVSFARLDGALEIPPGNPDKSGFTPVVVLLSGDKRIAFGVDEIVSEQEVLVKGLGRQLFRVRNVSGAAVLGSGKPVPILNIPDLMRSAPRASASPRGVPAAEKAFERRKSVLIAEDSITSRTLLKNILEGAGYDVKTSIDGIDAITLLKTQEFDLVVSDVEMPRMNGFDLTARIRADKRLADLPVVLVTALETREDRERGIEVGANAYIVKSSFNQSNLLEVIERLI